MYEILMHKILRDETRDTVPLTKIFVGCKKKKTKLLRTYYDKTIKNYFINTWYVKE